MAEFKVVEHWRRKVLLRNGKKCTPNAGDIIRFLLEEPGVPTSPECLILNLWGDGYPVDENALQLVRNHISKARKFLKDSESNYRIVTNRGEGLYYIEKNGI